MTMTQIAYREWREDRRHNRVGEKETHRHNKAGEKETHRHNVKTERLGTKQLGETIRHNMATERLGTADLSERTRHNLATEAETQRHNESTEDISSRDVAVREAKLPYETENLAKDALLKEAKISETNENVAMSIFKRGRSDIYTLMGSRDKAARYAGYAALAVKLGMETGVIEDTLESIYKFVNSVDPEALVEAIDAEWTKVQPKEGAQSKTDPNASGKQKSAGDKGSGSFKYDGKVYPNTSEGRTAATIDYLANQN